MHTRSRLVLSGAILSGRGLMADIFISYKRERRPAARHLEQILVRYGYSVWFDLALVRGADYEEQIQRELNAAKAVIVLWCGLSVASKGVRSEATRAQEQKKLIPVKIEVCELPLFSTLEQNIDLTAAACSPRDHALDPILDDLERLVGRAPVADLKALREYEATWRTMTGGLPLARLPLEQVAIAEAEAAQALPARNVQPSYDYGFWKAEWETHRIGSDLLALKAIAEHAPPYFATQARARIADVEGQQRWEAEEQERQARERAEIERRTAPWRADGRIRIDAAIFHGDSEAAKAGWLKPGAGKIEWFKDLDIGPEMVVVPGNLAFAIGRFALTFAEWDAAQAHPEWRKHSGIAPRKPEDEGWGRGKQPAINVSWNDAKAYCAWLSGVTSKPYRLPGEAEWEMACRAGTKTEFWWGDEISTEQANYDGIFTYGNGKKGDCRKRTVPVDNFQPNPWGLYQVHGNVWEWCEDAYKVESRILRGGSWFDAPGRLRSANRSWVLPEGQDGFAGFRLARTLLPP